MDEQHLSKRQRKWLEASRQIGRGAMTKTERETLERLYAEMLPAEQQELARYIEEKYGKKEPGKGQIQGSTADESYDEEPTKRMERKIWTEPSHALRSALSGSVAAKKRPSED